MKRTWAAGAAVLVCLALTILPAAGQSPAPLESGLVGSLWRDPSVTRYYLLHPDGTMVGYSRLFCVSGLGLGVWEPTGERSLTSRLVCSGPFATTTQRATWEIDEGAETALLTYTVAQERTDGTAVPDETGTTTLERLHLAPMFEGATFPTPAEPAWTLALGPAIYMPYGATQPFVTSETHGLSSAYNLAHADGTGLNLDPWVGNGVSLWAPTSALTSVATGWFYPTWHVDPPAVWESTISQGTGSIAVVYGTQLTNEGSTSVRAVEVMPLQAGAALPDIDPAWWPTRGAVWVEAAGDSPVTRTAYLADGTLVAVHPEYGDGAGPWRPTGPDTLASTTYYLHGMVQLRAESTVSADGETLTSRYVLVDPYPLGDEQTGTSTATRMHVEG